MNEPLNPEQAAKLYGNRFLTEDAPAKDFPASGMPALDAMRLVDEELVLEGDPWRNLATFVTTWMEPEAERIVSRKPPPQLHRPRRVSDLGRDRAALHPHARRPLQRARRDHRLPHPGFLGGDHARRAVAEVEVEAAAGSGWRPVDKPNLVFGGDVHVVWEKFCRYFDVEPRIVRLQKDKYVIGPEDVEPHVDENTIGVAAVLGTTFTGHADDIQGINDLLLEDQEREGTRRPAPRRRRQRRLRLALPLPRLGVGLPARAGALDQRLRPQVRARLPGDRLARLPREGRPRRGPRLLRELPGQDRRDLHPQLLDRRLDGARPVLQLRPPRARGLRAT